MINTMKIKKIFSLIKRKTGQSLVTLLVFMMIAISVTSAATVLIVNSSLATSELEESEIAYNVAESGIENALLRMLRNPNYTGETLAVGSGTATITITGTNPKTIVSEGRVGNFIRKVQVVADYSSILNITSWQEIY